MIFAEKLIQLRKKAGWSQEELAAQMNVSRQSVSKWEGAQSIPDLEKIIRLSQLFGVTTDYLLKDEIEGEKDTVKSEEEASSKKYVSMEEANAFLSVKEETSKFVANGVFLCILSPLCLMLLGAFGESGKFGISENAAGGLGMIIMFMIIAAAVAVFIYSGSKTAPYEYLEKEVFETAYGVTGMVKERKERYKDTYTKNTIIGVCLCVIAFIPLFAGVVINEENDIFMVCMLCISFMIAGVGVIFLVRSGIIWASFEKLLQEGDYSRHKKENPIPSVITTVYWLLVTAIFLMLTFPTKAWKDGWFIWVIGAILYPAVLTVVNAVSNKK